MGLVLLNRLNRSQAHVCPSQLSATKHVLLQKNHLPARPPPGSSKRLQATTILNLPASQAQAVACFKNLCVQDIVCGNKFGLNERIRKIQCAAACCGQYTKISCGFELAGGPGTTSISISYPALATPAPTSQVSTTSVNHAPN